MAVVIVNDKPVDIGTDKLNLIQAAQRAGPDRLRRLTHRIHAVLRQTIRLREGLRLPIAAVLAQMRQATALAANPQIGHANMPSPQSEIERYLRSGEHDPLFGAWPGGNVLECARRGDADLRRALVAEVKARTAAVSVPDAH